jgi:predicted Fe-Mo cluster-binding NifX family protein
MKIAAVTDDGRTISQHFGRAGYYAVLTVEDGCIIGQEIRDKMGHHHFAGREDPHKADPRGHGFGQQSHDRHVQMTQAIADCKILLARGMGRGALVSLQQLGIQAVLTDLADIQEAVQAYLDGTLVEREDLAH